MTTEMKNRIFQLCDCNQRFTQNKNVHIICFLLNEHVNLLTRWNWINIHIKYPIILIAIKEFENLKKKNE